MYFKQLSIGGFDKNFSHIVGDEKTREIFLVDPDNLRIIEDGLQKDDLVLKGIILTHGHFDHIGVSPELAEKYCIPVYLHFGDLPIVRKKIPNLKDLSKINKLSIGSVEINVIYTPGHAEGAVCLHIDNKLITGDTIFVGAVGRTDIPGSDPLKLEQSLAMLKQLPDETVIYPGHDYGQTPSSTIGRELVAKI